MLHRLTHAFAFLALLALPASAQQTFPPTYWYDEGTKLTPLLFKVDCIGAGITCASDTVNGWYSITVPGAAGGVTSISGVSPVVLTPDPIIATGTVGIATNPAFTGTATFTVGVDKAAAGTFQIGVTNATGFTIGGAGANATFGGAVLSGGNIDTSTATTGNLFTVNANAVNIASSAVTTAIKGNLTMATTKTLVVGANTLIGAVADKLNAANQAIASQATGDILYADTSSTFARLGIGAATTVLHGGTTPSYSAVSLTADVTGTLPTANGGTNLTSFTSGGAMYASSTSVLTTTATPAAGQIMRATSASAWAPSTTTYPNTIAAGDTLIGTGTNTIGVVTLGSSGKFLQSNGIAPVYSSSTWPTTTATGDLIAASSANTVSTITIGTAGKVLQSFAGVPTYSSFTFPTGTRTQGEIWAASSTTAFSAITDVAAGSYLRSGGLNLIPLWSTLTLPNAATTGDIFIATGTNAMGVLADVASGKPLVSGGVGAAPAYAAYTLPASIATGDLIIGNGTNTTTTLAVGGSTSILGTSGGQPSWTSNPTLTGITFGALLCSSTNPTISSGFGSGASIASTQRNGTCAFIVNVGTGGSSSGVIGLPTASNGWLCFCDDTTTVSTSVFKCSQSASTTTSATIKNYSNVAVQTNWTDSDLVQVSCFGY